MPDLINNALNEMKNISEIELSDEIESFSKIVNDNDIETLMNGNLFEILPEELENQLNQISSNLESVKDEDIKLASNYLNIASFFANKSINEGFVYFWPISVIFYYFRVKPEFLKQIVTVQLFSKINENISEVFSRLENNFNVSEDAPYFEKESFKRYQNGLEKDNLKSVYNFIESVERGKGIYASFFVEFLAQLLLLEPQKYFSFLEDLKEPVTLVEYIHIIENKLNIEFTNLIISSNNKWMLFEYIRQIFKDLNINNNLSNDEVESCSLLFERLYNLDECFFIAGIIFLAKYKNKKYLGICLGNVLVNINEKNLIKELIDAFGINERHFYLDLWAFIGKTLENKSEELWGYISQIIFCKWDKFFISQFKSDKIIIGPIYTDYCKIIIMFLQNYLSNDRSNFLKLLEEKLDAIINYKSYWVKYPSRKRLICLSYVFVMSEAWKNVLDSKIDDELEEKLLFVMDDKRMLIALPNYDENTHKKILEIKENFKV